MRPLLLLFIILFSSVSHSEEDKEFNRLVDRIITLTGDGVSALVSPTIERYSLELAESLVSQKPWLPPEAVEVIKSEISLFFYEQLINNEKLKQHRYSQYKKHFAKIELEEIVEFYESDIGKKINRIIPKIVAESNESSQVVFESLVDTLIQNIAPRINKRIEDNGW